MRPLRFFLIALALASVSGCRLVGTPPPDRTRVGPLAGAGRGGEADGRVAEGVKEGPEGRSSSEPGPAREPRSAEEVERITSGVVETAMEALGTPYLWSGTDENGFDCSGLIQYAYASHGVDLPRISGDQIRAGRAVVPRVDALRPGDILGFTRDLDRSVSHVGLYLGEGRFIHSSSRGVMVSNLTDPYWREHVVAATRVVR